MLLQSNDYGVEEAPSVCGAGCGGTGGDPARPARAFCACFRNKCTLLHAELTEQFHVCFATEGGGRARFAHTDIHMGPAL
jgi:hypothetical protein